MEHRPPTADLVALGLLALATLAAFVALTPDSTASRASHPPAPRRVDTSSRARVPRPPRVVYEDRAPSTALATVPAQSTTEVGTVAIVVNSVGTRSEDLEGIGESASMDFSSIDMGHWSYHRSGRWYRRGHYSRGVRYAPRRPMMASGWAPIVDDDATDAVVCDLFPLACGASAPRGSRHTRRVARVPAAVDHQGTRWDLSNETLVASIDPGIWCRVMVARRGGDELPSSTERFGWTIDTPEPSPCTVTETTPSWPGPTGAALSVTWNGRGWTQRAVISLDDDAGSPELELTRETTTASGATTRTERRWTFEPAVNVEGVSGEHAHVPARESVGQGQN